MDILQETNWFAVQTKRSQEDLAAFNLNRLGLDLFLPKVRGGRAAPGTHNGKTKPMFPRYLFARFSPLRYMHLIIYARGVSQIVCAGHMPLPVDESIINSIRDRVGPDGFLDLASEVFQPGDRITVQGGPFDGNSGVFEREVDERKRVIILLESIRYQARVVVDRPYVIRGT